MREQAEQQQARAKRAAEEELVPPSGAVSPSDALVIKAPTRPDGFTMPREAAIREGILPYG